MCRNEANIHEKSASELNQKRCLKTELKKPKKSQKMTPKLLQKNHRILREIPIGAPLVVQTVFVMKKWVPALPKCSQGSKNEPKMKQKSPPSNYENEPQKSTLLGAKRK